MMGDNYAIMARKQGSDYFKIVRYDGKRRFSEEEVDKVKDLLEQRDYETAVVEHRSPFDVIDLDELIMIEFTKRKMESSE